MQTSNPFPDAVVVFKRVWIAGPKPGMKRLIGPKVEGTYPYVVGVMTPERAVEYWLQEWETNKNEDYSLFETHWGPLCLCEWKTALHLAGYMSEPLDLDGKDPELVARVRAAEAKKEERTASG